MGYSVTRCALHLVRSPPANSDAEALARIAGGDLRGLGELYDRYAPELWRFARRAAPSENAEDIVHLVFERLVRNAGSYDGRSPSARQWLFGVAARVLCERRRSLRRFAKALKARAPTDRATTAAHAHPQSMEVEWALAELKSSKRIVFLLAEVEGFSSPEIAKMLRLPVRTVWTRLHHARRELRALLGDELQ